MRPVLSSLIVTRPAGLVVVAAAVVWLSVLVVRSPWRALDVINSDAYGYNMYLVAAISPHGMGDPRTFDDLEDQYGELRHVRGYARHPVGDGRVAFKYTMGVAVLHAPLFGAAHAYARWTGGPADGFAEPYQVATALSTWLWGVLALGVTGRLLRRWFTEGVTAVTLLMIAFGTNAFHYSTLVSGMSHLPSMALFGATLLAALAWLDRPGAWRAALAGAGLGLIGLVRPTDLVFLVVPAAVFLRHLATRPPAERRHADAAIACACALLVLSLQLLYWKHVTGAWLFYGYQGEALNPFNAYIVEGLLGFRKGWLVYTPLMGLALVGLPWFVRREPWLGRAVVVFLALHVWVVFSWQEWWYGGGFGARSMIQAYAVLALPLACSVERWAGWWRAGRAAGGTRVLAGMAGLLVVGAIGLNLFQAWQFERGLLHGTHMHRDAYWAIFGATALDDTDMERLYPGGLEAASEAAFMRDSAAAPATGITVAAYAAAMVLALLGLRRSGGAGWRTQ